MTAQVSVIVPTFNRAQMLQECVASLLRQTQSPLEIIVVDDGSTDDTAAVVRRMPPPVRYLYKSNAGKPAALNFALPHAAGQWIWFFDDDDVALPRSIEARLQALPAAPDARVVISRFVWGESGADGELHAGKALQWPEFSARDFYPKFLRSCFAHLNGALIRRDRTAEIEGFRTDLLTSEDYDFTLRAARGERIAICNEPTFIFRQHGGQRGPHGQRYSASERLRKFADGDAAIGRSIRSTHSLPEYLGLPADHELDPLPEREALLARLQVMAGKGLLAEVAADAIALCQASDQVGAAIDPRMATALKSALQERYLTFPLCESPDVALNSLAPLRSSAAGRTALGLFARSVAGLAWWQKMTWVERVRIAWLALRLKLMSRG
jgi:GT2 family glycosyltransferase